MTDTRSSNPRLWHPRHWPSWLGMGLAWLLACLPFAAQLWIGRRLGELTYHLLPGRRRVAAVNLKLCFPEKSDAERNKLLRAHFRSVGMGAMETLKEADALSWLSQRIAVTNITKLREFANGKKPA